MSVHEWDICRSRAARNGGCVVWGEGRERDGSEGVAESVEDLYCRVSPRAVQYRCVSRTEVSPCPLPRSPLLASYEPTCIEAGSAGSLSPRPSLMHLPPGSVLVLSPAFRTREMRCQANCCRPAGGERRCLGYAACHGARARYCWSESCSQAS